ncbi:MAG TPA: NYN domain-containing protein [Enhygromyxa sp.]|nr:NYN domain-containing protein [Enhygromyxa sp.]
MANDRVAMFIDFENLVYGVENNDAVRNEEPDLDVDIQRLVRFVRDEGRLVMARAYADWSRASVRQHQRELYVQGIETVHVFGRRYGNEVKNSVDVALAVDAVRSLYERQFDTFVLISGDRDFLPLLRVVREQGHRIIGVSVRESASKDLPNLCDRFVYYRDLWRTYGPEEQRDRGPSEVEFRDLALFKEQLRALLGEEVGAGGILGATLKPMIRNRIDPGFDETQFGFLKFSKMLEAMPDVVRFEYTSDVHGGDIRVFAVDEPRVDLPITRAASDSETDEPTEPSQNGVSVTAAAPVNGDPVVVVSTPTIPRPQPIRVWEPTPEAFGSRARARLARTGLHLDQPRRAEILATIYAELPLADDGYRTQAEILERLEGRATASGVELEHATLRRYLWALYQSWIFDINPQDRGLDHLERGLRVKPEYRDLDRLRLRLEQSLVYKVYELLPDNDEDKRARIRDLLEIDDSRARELLDRVEDYRRTQQLRGR